MNKARLIALRANKKLLFFTRLLVEVKAFNAVLTLFYLSRGISIGQVIYLSVAWSIASLILEVPSGYLADKIGRKNTILIGVALYSVGIITMMLASTFFMFLLSIVIVSASFTCFTGTDSALLFDTLRELGDEKSSLRVSGKYYSSARFAKIFIPLLGAIIAKDLLPWQFTLLLSVDLIASLIAFFVASKIVEPNRYIDVSEKEKNLFRDSVKVFRTSSLVRKFAINKALVFIGTLIIFRIYQPVLQELGMSIVALGIIYAIFQLLTFLSMWFFEKIDKKMTGENLLQIPVYFGIAGVVLFIFSNNLVLLSIATIISLILGTFRDPIFFEQINLRIKSYNRATTTSMLTVIRSFFDIPVLLFIGYLSNIDYSYAFYAVLVLYLISTLFFSIKRNDIQLVGGKK